MEERDAYEVLQVHPKADLLIILAAYRILATKYHPDHDPSPGANRRMAELNGAFEALRTEDRRALYDRQRALVRTTVAIVTPYSAPNPQGPADSAANVIDFGRYAGWTLEQVAKQDREYLRWLSRHTSGIRFRRRIQELLNDRGAGVPSTGKRR
jgi:curved DNA-binding protein CbpA